MDLATVSFSDRDVALRLLKYESCRLATFDDDWPHEMNPELTKQKLAAGGFFFTGRDDHVQCAFCLLMIGYWEPTDTVAGEHRRHTLDAQGGRFRFCPFVAGFPTGNIPMDPATGQDITGPSAMEILGRLMNRQLSATIPSGEKKIELKLFVAS
jgi:hypothetical protein